MEISLKGKFNKIVFHSESGFTVAIFDSEDGEVLKVTGDMGIVDIGAKYKIVGEYFEHRSYGRQFNIKDFEILLPEDGEEMLEFLKSGAIKGIGEKVAEEICETFGGETFKILKEAPERLLEIKGIGNKTLEKIIDSYNEKIDFIEIAKNLSTLGISQSFAKKIYEAYGNNAETIIKENPYRMIDDIHGIGFLKSDEIAQKIGFPKDDKCRIEAVIKQMLMNYESGGSTCVPLRRLVSKVEQYIGVSENTVKDIIMEMLFLGSIEIDQALGEETVYPLATFSMENEIVLHTSEMLENSPIQLPIIEEHAIEKFEKDKGILLSDEQKKAVMSALKNHITVITGGPGTGKTTIISGIATIFKNLDLEVGIVAPTGRAAKKVNESSGFEAKTIHRMLEAFPSESGNIIFQKNEEDKLDHDVIIVDEASMIDTYLMASLMKAIKTEARLIIVGDANQLPSVGAGKILKDIIDSKIIETVHLKEIFRQAKKSLIISNAHKINRGEMIDVREQDSEFKMIELHNQSEILSKIEETVIAETIKNSEEGKDITKVQIITPTKKGVLGTINLNERLQNILNPKNESSREIDFRKIKFRTGDKVMQTKNDYLIKWKSIIDMEEGSGIFNGDVGQITGIEPGSGINIKFDDKYVEYDAEELENITHAYAITVHKSQGSEYQTVIMPIHDFTHFLMSRKLLYTAVTRAKKKLILIGDPKYLQSMIENDRETIRYTGLTKKLKNIVLKNENFPDIL